MSGSAEFPGRFSSASVMALGVGPQLDPEGIAGYPIDMRVKAPQPSWPPSWLNPPGTRLWVAHVQFGLGAHERWLQGDGDAFLEAAVACADDLLEHMQPGGGWPHGFAYPHSYVLPAGWVSGITQGEAASFLVRIGKATGSDRYGEAARLAIHPMTVPSREGGCLTQLAGGPFPEEYPTDPPSYVLNGSMFGMWGVRDVAVALDSETVRTLWEDMVATLRDNLERWDLGWWSKYDLFPHAAKNPASSFYHHLHIAQLRATALLSGEARFTEVADRWQRYADSRARSARAFASKAKFRIVVPRNPWLADRIPWARRGRPR